MAPLTWQQLGAVGGGEGIFFYFITMALCASCCFANLEDCTLYMFLVISIGLDGHVPKLGWQMFRN